MDQLDYLAGQREPVLPLVFYLKARQQFRPAVLVQVTVGKPYLKLVVLPGVPHGRAARNDGVGDLDAAPELSDGDLSDVALGPRKPGRNRLVRTGVVRLHAVHPGLSDGGAER